MAANSRKALAMASPVVLKMAVVSRWAPPTGSVMMTALDHVDRVDLHVAEMLDRRLRGRGAHAERRRTVEPLGAQPQPARLRLRDGVRLPEAGHRAAA